MNSDYQLIPTQRHVASPDDTISLFISLYIVTLAFFILLTSHASFDEKKVENVTQSLNKTFVSSTTTVSPIPLAGGMEISRFFSDIEGNLKSIIPLAEMEIIRDGRQMMIHMPSTALYNRDDPKLRYDRSDFYARLSDTMNAWREGLEVDLSMIQGVATPQGTTPTNTTLEVTRAGNFARFMENRGAAPENIAIAIEQGKPNTITLIFDVHPREEGTLPLSHAQKTPTAGISLQSVERPVK